MSIKIIKSCNRIIRYSFYLLLALVPLIFTPFNFELFEFNKMWVTYILTIIIVASWLIRMLLEREIKIQRTPLDIPILLFLTALVLSTIFSIDVHTSLWGYYSRSNGGLLSIISYILLYFAFTSNYNKDKGIMTNRLLFISLITGALVALYGVLEHFGIDSKFWVQDVKNRVFSTLGQPNWLAAYLSILIPVSLALGLQDLITQPAKKILRNSLFIILASLFYLCLLYTKSRSGFLGFGVGLIFFLTVAVIPYLNFKIKPITRLITYHLSLPTVRYLLVIIGTIGLITFIVGTPFEQLKNFTLQGIRSANDQRLITKPPAPALEVGGTESGEIRKIVWQGAINIARAYPIFGSGVETFAYSYYKFRPAAHNLTSEWDFLYNKAHNEYLNYLATTGFLGLGTYLLMIGVFLWLTTKKLLASIGLLSGYISILVSNFFGFSVVLVNLYFFLIPAFVFTLGQYLDPKKSIVLKIRYPQIPQFVSLLAVILVAYYLLLNLFLFWLADKDYARGYNLARTGQFEQGYESLRSAVEKRSDEPIFKDELAGNAAILATAFYTQNESTTAAKLANQAVALSKEVTVEHPNNVTFWKSQARLFYTLSGMDKKYLLEALSALERTHLLAPTDPKISYNLALLYGQIDPPAHSGLSSGSKTGGPELAIKTLEETIKLKSDYRDAHYALGIFYDEGGQRQKAIAQMDYILRNIASDDAEVTQKLLEWRGY